MYIIKGKIDSNNASEFEKELLAELPKELDASMLEYISSAGLRVLLKLTKTVGEVTINNVSSEVYDIFDVTGFTNILNVNKALREISIEGKKIIGKGGNGTVYRLDDETIVKVYRPDISLDTIDRERAYARAAFVAGIPSVIAYDMVKVGDSYGVVYEAMNSDNLGRAISNDPGHTDDYVAKYVALAKKLHSTPIKNSSIISLKDFLMRKADHTFMREHLEQNEIDVLKDIINAMADRDTLVHGDLHPGNIMLQDGELMRIDMGEITLGVPIYDVAAVYRDLISAPQNNSGIIEQSTGLKSQQCIEVGKKFLAMYSGITDPAQFEQYMKTLGLIYAFNVAMLMPDVPDASKRAPLIVNNLIRPVLLPNAEALKLILSK